MLVVATLELRDPMALFVLMITDDGLFHCVLLVGVLSGFIRTVGQVEQWHTSVGQIRSSVNYIHRWASQRCHPTAQISEFVSFYAITKSTNLTHC